MGELTCNVPQIFFDALAPLLLRKHQLTGISTDVLDGLLIVAV